MPATFAALAVAVYAVLPGASFIFGYSARAGSYGKNLPDRLVRFVAVSVVLQALFSFITYPLYRDLVLTGRLQRGELPTTWVWIVAVSLTALPYLLGWLVGHAVRENWLSIRSLLSVTVEPRAWDHVFQLHKPHGLIRLRMKSGIYVAGVFGEADQEAGADDFPSASHASGYPEDGDLYLYETIVVDPTTGVPDLDADGDYIPCGSGLLVRWNDVELIEVFRS